MSYRGLQTEVAAQGLTGFTALVVCQCLLRFQKRNAYFNLPHFSDDLFVAWVQVFFSFLPFIFSTAHLPAGVCVPPSDSTWSCLPLREAQSFVHSPPCRGREAGGVEPVLLRRFWEDTQTALSMQTWTL